MEPKAFMAYSILIVDDSNTVRAAILKTLKMTRLPFEKIMQASDGAEALTLLNQHWFDIVLSDIHMPHMDGVCLVEHMNRDPALSSTPVIIISTEGSQTRIEQLKKKGISGYLRKPFTPEAIRDAIVEVLGAWNE